jgi:hypothetical protein
MRRVHAYIRSMHRIIPAVLLLWLAVPAVAQEATDVAASDPIALWQEEPTTLLDGAAEATELRVADFAFLARPLVVFADTPRDPQFAEQMRLLEQDMAALATRDVVVIVDTDPSAGGALRGELRPRGFGLVLLDKDGRVGLRRPSPQTVRELTRTIDRMPLRQEETRYRGGGEG